MYYVPSLLLPVIFCHHILSISSFSVFSLPAFSILSSCAFCQHPLSYVQPVTSTQSPATIFCKYFLPASSRSVFCFIRSQKHSQRPLALLLPAPPFSIFCLTSSQKRLPNLLPPYSTRIFCQHLLASSTLPAAKRTHSAIRLFFLHLLLASSVSHPARNFRLIFYHHILQEFSASISSQRHLLYPHTKSLPASFVYSSFDIFCLTFNQELLPNLLSTSLSSAFSLIRKQTHSQRPLSLLLPAPSISIMCITFSQKPLHNLLPPYPGRIFCQHLLPAFFASSAAEPLTASSVSSPFSTFFQHLLSNVQPESSD